MVARCGLVVEGEGRRQSHKVHAVVLHRDPHGDPAFISLVAHDITQRKEVERMKDELVATVSHELRTPLASLRGFSELMLKL